MAGQDLIDAMKADEAFIKTLDTWFSEVDRMQSCNGKIEPDQKS